MKGRINLFTIVITLGFVLVSARLFYWQIVKGSELSDLAKYQYGRNTTIQAPRGNILASDKSWLVARGDAYLVYAQAPQLTKTAKEVANNIAPIFVEDKEDKEANLAEEQRLEDLLNKKDLVWVALKQKISPEQKTNIEALGLDGIGFQLVEDRLYPEASSAAQLLGFVGKNEEGQDQGYFGLEGNYDLTLSGKPGYKKLEKDAQGKMILTGDEKQVEALEGIDLQTTINKSIQLTAEKKLKEGIEKYGASGGTVSVMDPTSGAILAMASYPSYDPRSYWDYSDAYFKNPVISSSFEPGSVFKVVVMASALDAGKVEPDTKCDICSGPVKVDKYFIETWNNEYHPDSTMTDVIVHSDNVGMVFVAQRMGADLLYDYLDKFQIGSLTGIDLQGEASPKLRERGSWNIVDLSTASFGQGIAITPIQLLRAVGAIANDGVMSTPYVVSTLFGSGWQEDIRPVYSNRVVSKEAADEMTAMMEAAAEEGESKWIQASGYRVAGKTGTAQIPIAGHYDPEKTNASFVGFAPAEEPKFVMLVTLNEPKTSPWASETAAPLWYDIAKDIFIYLNIRPEN